MARLEFRGVHREILYDTTPERDVEGALSSGKTTLCLWCELEALRKHPGIWIFIARYTDLATKNLLRPAFEQMIRIHKAEHASDAMYRGDWRFNREENYYEFPNDSRAYSFGIQTQSHDPEQRYGKIRGLPASRIYIDQAEQLPEDIASELRARLRPDIEARMRGADYPRQLTFSPNPPGKKHWLALQFPENNSIPGRKYFCVSLFDNRHNLPVDQIDALLRTYPPNHSKHRTVILGKRGTAAVGDPVYGGTALELNAAFQRSLHERALTVDKTLPLLESIESGKRNCAVVWAQFTPYGQLLLHGGLVAHRMTPEDFAPILNRYRAQWFPNQLGPVHTCCNPQGAHEGEEDLRQNAIADLQNLGFAPVWKDHSNSPDVRKTLIDRLTAYMRKRTPKGEAFGIEADENKWLSVSASDIQPWKFLADGCESGYVWDEHPVSVASKEIAQTKKDDEYEYGMSALELLEYNFGGAQPSVAQLERHAQKLAFKALRTAQKDDVDPYRWQKPHRRRRAGY